jgi:hypothetical protein
MFIDASEASALSPIVAVAQCSNLFWCLAFVREFNFSNLASLRPGPNALNSIVSEGPAYLLTPN